MVPLVPICRFRGRRHFEDMVDDLVVEFREGRPVFLKEEGFGEAGEGRWCFEYDEVVDAIVELVESDLQPVKLGVDHEEIIDFSRLRYRTRVDWIPIMFPAVSGDIPRYQQACLSIFMYPMLFSSFFIRDILGANAVPRAGIGYVISKKYHKYR